MNIYVGNLPYTSTEEDIRQIFAAFGQVKSVAIIKDKMTGQSRGFAFVEMANDAEAQAAIAGLNGKSFQNRSLVVNPARPREERGGMGGDRRPGGFGDRNRMGGGMGGGGGDRRPRGGNDRGGGERRRRDDW
jgi:RNA recognition motif-containing protein